MKKTSLWIVGALLLGYAAKSQSRFGLKAGLNLANQVKTISIPSVPNTTQDTEPFVGYQLGVFYKAKLSSHLSLSTEANFSVIGSGMTLVTSDGKSYDTKDKLGYIEIPVMVQYSINKLYFAAGPGVGYKLFSKLTNFEDRSYDITYYQSIDAAANLLAGFALSNAIDVNVRYSHGLVNLYNDGGYATAKNKFLNLSILYFLK